MLEIFHSVHFHTSGKKTKTKQKNSTTENWLARLEISSSKRHLALFLF